VVKCHFKDIIKKFSSTNINHKGYQGINLDKLQSLVDGGKYLDTVKKIWFAIGL
jgi:hypothetical protein